MTVIELNAQLLRELSYISDNEGYLQKTLDFIKKLTKSNVASNVRGQIYTGICCKITIKSGNRQDFIRNLL